MTMDANTVESAKFITSTVFPSYLSGKFISILLSFLHAPKASDIAAAQNITDILFMFFIIFIICLCIYNTCHRSFCFKSLVHHYAEHKFIGLLHGFSSYRREVAYCLVYIIADYTLAR